MDKKIVKLELIKAIANLEDHTLLLKVRELLGVSIPYTEVPPLSKIAGEPVPDYISLNELKVEQAYSIDHLNKAFEDIDHSLWADEDTDEVLSLL